MVHWYWLLAAGYAGFVAGIALATVVALFIYNRFHRTDEEEENHA